MEYTISRIFSRDKNAKKQVEALLSQEGINIDANIELTLGIYDDLKLIATGSIFKNTFRCLAVDHNYQGEGLMNLLITELLNYQQSLGYENTFVYTKKESAKFFRDLGFYPIVQLDNLVFLENKYNGFNNYLTKLENDCQKLKNYDKDKNACAIVMNANPFTLGHQYLVEKAAQTCEILHLFIVSQDSSLVPFNIREKLIQEGTSHIKNIVYHSTDDYIISMATFPSYFLKSEDEVIKSQVKLDIDIFSQIAKNLNITKRIVGDEPFSHVTTIYNDTMKDLLPKHNIALDIIKRKEENSVAISASAVRQLIKEGNFDKLKTLVPTSTYNYFISEEAKEVVSSIQKATEIIHH